MIIYRETVNNFINQCFNGTGAYAIENIVSERMRLCGINAFDESQKRAWANSLPEMAKILRNSQINGTVDVAIEYKIHQSRDRIDFLICGQDENNRKNIVIVELKQWSVVSKSNKKNFVHTIGGHGEGDYWHPSYQAANYSQLLINFNEYIREKKVSIPACSYLHNMAPGNAVLLNNRELFPLTETSPVFYNGDGEKLGKFIERHIRKPDKGLLYDVENSKIIPSKYLADMLSQAIRGNEFFSYDEAQATAVAQIVSSVRDAIYYNSKETIIIRGGAGTGKSVVAINALGQLLNSTINGRRPNTVYVTSNSAPRVLYAQELIRDDFTKSSLKSLFVYPTVFVHEAEDNFDCALVDEGHRIFDFKGGVGIKKGTHVLEEIIKKSKVSVFFIDENQAVTDTDFATIERIREAALRCRSRVIESPQLELKTQFRVTGGEEYIAFVRSFLGYDDRISFYAPQHYELKICDSAVEMRELLREKEKHFAAGNKRSGKCRMVAGYTYEWVSKNESRNTETYDIILDNGAFRAKWNLRCNEVGKDYSWLNDPDSFEEVGCVHTCQGLDMNYCGVIIGKDLTYQNGKLCYNPQAEAKSDRNSGIRRASPERAEQLIRNTYYVLLTRGMLGTYVYCEDDALREHLKNMVRLEPQAVEEPELDPEKIVYLPVVGEIAAGHEHFMEEDIEDEIPTDRSLLHPPTPGKYFYLSVSGDSMTGAGIEDGDFVLIRRMSNVRADVRNGDVIACMIHGDRATLKTYYKKPDGILLQPENEEYEPIFVPMEDFMIGEARIIGKMVGLVKQGEN